MSRPVGETPYLPNAGRASDIQGLNAFDQDLTKALFFYLSELARRANATLPKDGQESMTGPLTLTSGQIIFPAVQVPSTNANTLDDYEEGTWTPTLSFGGGSTGITYLTRIGSYIKIGRLVFIDFEIDLTSKGSSTGSALISGLPFPMTRQATGSYGFYANMAFPAGTIGTILGYGTNATGIDLRYHSNTNTTAANDTQFTNTSRLIGSAIYIANA